MNTNKNILLCGVAAVGVLIAQAAGAADLPVQATQPIFSPAPVYNWSGFYAGLHIGGGAAHMDGVFENGGGDNNSRALADWLQLNGLAAGIHGGYNWQLSTLVVGVEADLTFTNWDDNQVSPDSDEEGVSGSVDLLASIRGRVGLPIMDGRTMVFATGGIAFSDAELTSWRDDSTQSTDFDVGGVVGAGVEWAASDRFHVRAEGLYYFFDDSVDACCGNWPSSNSGDFAEFDDAWVVRIGGSYRFGGNY